MHTQSTHHSRALGWRFLREIACACVSRFFKAGSGAEMLVAKLAVDGPARIVEKSAF